MSLQTEPVRFSFSVARWAVQGLLENLKRLVSVCRKIKNADVARGNDVQPAKRRDVFDSMHRDCDSIPCDAANALTLFPLDSVTGIKAHPELTGPGNREMGF